MRHLRRRSRVQGVGPFFPQAFGVRETLAGVGEPAAPLASQRPEFHPALSRRGTERPGNHQGPHLGGPGAVGRLRRKTDLRLVRSRQRIFIGGHRMGAAQRRRPTLGAVLEGSQHQGLLLHRKGQHPVPYADLAGDADGVRRAQFTPRRSRQ